MDGSCIAEIFMSRNLNVLARTIHANIHTDINIIYPYLYTLFIVRLNLWKCLLKKQSFELGFEVSGDSASWQATNSRQLGQ